MLMLHNRVFWRSERAFRLFTNTILLTSIRPRNSMDTVAHRNHRMAGGSDGLRLPCLELQIPLNIREGAPRSSRFRANSTVGLQEAEFVAGVVAAAFVDVGVHFFFLQEEAHAVGELEARLRRRWEFRRGNRKFRE